LEGDPQSSATDACSDQLVTIPVFLIPTDLILQEKAFHRFLESDAVIGKLVALKIILEVRWLEKVPVYHDAPLFSRTMLRSYSTAPTCPGKQQTALLSDLQPVPTADLPPAWQKCTQPNTPASSQRSPQCT
jgi:hypothetical protein